jgi:hypothetical protein
MKKEQSYMEERDISENPRTNEREMDQYEEGQ